MENEKKCIEKELIYNEALSLLSDKLNDENYRIIALSGKWGCGKSYLWSQVENEKIKQQISSRNPKMNKNIFSFIKRNNDQYAIDTKIRYATVSLFGIKTIEELKNELAVSLLEYPKKVSIANGKSLADGLMESVPYVGKILKATSSISIDYAIESALENAIIAIDDIERRSPSLSLSDLLGYVDRTSKKNNTRFVLIANTDKFEDATEWKIIQEKVIDYTLTLNTTPFASASIAIDLFIKRNNIKTTTPSHGNVAKSIHQVMQALDITNTRLALKIITLTNEILKKKEQYSNIFELDNAEFFIERCFIIGYHASLGELSSTSKDSTLASTVEEISRAFDAAARKNPEMHYAYFIAGKFDELFLLHAEGFYTSREEVQLTFEKTISDSRAAIVKSKIHAAAKKLETGGIVDNAELDVIAKDLLKNIGSFNYIDISNLNSINPNRPSFTKEIVSGEITSHISNSKNNLIEFAKNHLNCIKNASDNFQYRWSESLVTNTLISHIFSIKNIDSSHAECFVDILGAACISENFFEMVKEIPMISTETIWRYTTLLQAKPNAFQSYIKTLAMLCNLDNGYTGNLTHRIMKPLKNAFIENKSSMEQIRMSEYIESICRKHQTDSGYTSLKALLSNPS